jgi:hypothetical protein
MNFDGADSEGPHRLASGTPLLGRSWFGDAVPRDKPWIRSVSDDGLFFGVRRGCTGALPVMLVLMLNVKGNATQRTQLTNQVTGLLS